MGRPGLEIGKVLTPPANTAEAGGDVPRNFEKYKLQGKDISIARDIKDTSNFDITKPDLKFQTDKPFSASEIPDSAELQANGWILFKQTKELFKQVQDPDTGDVIGLIYKGPRMSGLSTLNIAGVRSRRKIYADRAAAGEVSEAVANGVDVWEWALGLFTSNKSVNTGNLQTIHETEPVEAAEV
jgi:hypothetical protein